MKNTNGGPAFPNRFVSTHGELVELGGMSLRDYFAGQAMQRLLNVAGEVISTLEACDLQEILARKSYEMADVMLKVRANG